jgi:hypothetical protein
MNGDLVTYTFRSVERVDDGHPTTGQEVHLIPRRQWPLQQHLFLLFGTPLDAQAGERSIRQIYEGPDTDQVLEVVRTGTARHRLSATLRLDPISVRFALGVAEIAQSLSCALAPDDDGPMVAPSAEALLSDLARRALDTLRLPGMSRAETTSELRDLSEAPVDDAERDARPNPA